MIRILLFALTLLAFSFSKAQNTVGTISIDEGVFEGFTLISINTNAYLLNNCGEVINEWNSNYLPGNAVYLLPNGNLLRAGRYDENSSTIEFGGQGGIIELFDWDGNLTWSFIYSTNEFRQHHDIFPMPNGNVLILAATVMTEIEAIEAGRDPNLLQDGELYNEQIIEVEPVGTNEGNIVWEWNIKDHFIQDFDATKDNFGDVGSTPEKLDINFLNGLNSSANWLHFNSIQYDANLDQIVISSRKMSEVYIIDHSTTTAEAATNSGGNYGKGGDLLYRWGNPQTYRQGTESDRTLYGQHYPHFIEQGLEGEGKLLIFNNGNGRIPEFSEVLIITPPTSSPGVYSYTPDSAYGPMTIDYNYSDQSETPSPFFSSIVSSAQRLPNGNMLICEGRNGDVFEIDQDENMVWKYINPVNNNDGTITSQGDEVPPGNILFRAIKYATDYPAFEGRDLSPSAPLELNPDLTPCENLSVETPKTASIKIYPNPTNGSIEISALKPIDRLIIYSISGKKIKENDGKQVMDISAFPSGLYLLQIQIGEQQFREKIVKI